MISTITKRVAYCVVGYLWAAFVAAVAITLFRSVQDLLANAITVADIPLYVVSLISIMTTANIVSSFIPVLVVFAALEVVRIAKLPAIGSLYSLAGACCGYYLATQAVDGRPETSALEVMFHAVSWALGGLAFWHMTIGRPADAS